MATDPWQIIEGDCRDVLRTLPAGSVHTCVTSPPYFGLRDYGTGEWDGGDPACDHLKVSDAAAAVATSTLGGGKKTTGHIQEGFGSSCGKCGAIRVDRQIGLEPTPDEFVAALVAVFREIRRVLRDDGTVWLNLGDSYANTADWKPHTGAAAATMGGQYRGDNGMVQRKAIPFGVKPKDLLGVPWMVAFALRADGWYLRSDIIWAKPNPMPESVTDRPTKAHEYVFLLSKSAQYAYDADAIRETSEHVYSVGHETDGYSAGSGRHDGTPHRAGIGFGVSDAGRNKRSVWTVATQPYAGAHFATFPPKLIEPCILAGAPEGGTVLDPFAGAGTTGIVALQHGREFVGIELNPEYAQMARDRIETAVRLGFRSPQRGPDMNGHDTLFDMAGGQ